MTIASAITAAQVRVADAYTAISNKGGTLSQTQDLSNMPTAINSIPTGSSKYGCTIDNFLGNKDANNKLLEPRGTFNLDLSGVEELGEYALYAKFSYNRNINMVDMSDVIIISGAGATYRLLQSSNATSVDLSSLETVSGSDGCYYMCQNTHITSANLSKLKTVSGSNGCFYMYNAVSASYADIISVDLSLLETVSGSNGCYYMLAGQINLPATFNSLPKLKTVSGSSGLLGFLQGFSNQPNYITSFSFPLLDTITGQYAMQRCFRYRTALQHIYFNALTTRSFGSTYTNQFDNMVQNITGCTIHLPSNLPSTIAGLTGYPNFGGDNTVLAFDLPATS